MTITSDFAARFKQSYSYKMGGTQTIVMPDGQRFYFDDRQYYNGRGAKYNSSIRHDMIGDVVITQERVDAVMLQMAANEQRRLDMIAENNASEERIVLAKKSGVYSINECESGRYIELSEDESEHRYFDAARLASTLGITVEDASLLKSRGKTYVFAKSQDGNIYELYHASLSCNPLNIWISIATPERVAEFNPEKWQSAPYAAALGQTIKPNHFVC